MSFEVFTFWISQYPIAALISLFVAIFIYKRNRHSYAYISFLAYGITVALWLMLVYLHRTASSLEISRFYFVIGTSFFEFVFPLILLTLLNILRERISNALVLIPSFFGLLFEVLSLDPEMVMTSYGWSYRLRYTSEYAFASRGILTIGYVSALAVILYVMTKNIQLPKLYRRRYLILVLSFFGFQVIGIILSNIYLMNNPDTPPMSGILNLGSFLLTGYALLMTEVRVQTQGGSTLVGPEQFHRAYATFLERYLSSLPGIELGQAGMRFHEFLQTTGMAEFITETGSGYAVEAEAFARADHIQLLDRILKTLERSGEEQETAQYLGYPLLLTYFEVQDTSANFVSKIVQGHQDFLLASGLLYMSSLKAFLGQVKVDTSLERQEDWLAAFRLYIRMIASMMTPELFRTLGDDLKRRAELYNLAKYLDFDPVGNPLFNRSEIAMNLGTDPLNTVIGSLNPFLSWLVEHMYTLSEQAGDEALKSIRDVIGLNREIATRLRVYPILLSSLSTRLSRRRLTNVFLTGAYDTEELNRFSRQLGITHEELIGKVVMLEFDPRVSFQTHIENFVTEAKANGESLVIFTRRRSDVDIITGIAGVDKYYLTPGGRKSGTPQDEKTIPLNDMASLLAVVSSLSSDPFTSVLFDNLTDLCATLGQEVTYSTLRHITEALGDSKAPLLFLMNAKAHSPEVVSMFETLSNLIITQEGDNLRAIKK